MSADSAGRPRHGQKAPNLVLRRIREQERHETREQFAESMARVARDIGECVFPDEKYVAKLEAGDIRYPRPPYRRVLAEVCGLPFGKLGFGAPSGLYVTEETTDSPHSLAPAGRLNVPLRDAVMASDLELAQIARRVGVHPKTMQRWITQGVVPHGRHRWKTCKVLGRDEPDLWPGTALQPQVSLPEAVEATSPAVLNHELAASHGSEDLIDVLSRIQRLHRSAVHPEIISHMQGNLSHIVTQYETLDHSDITPILTKQRAWIDVILRDCARPNQRQELVEIAGATSGVLGYIAVGRGDFPLARAYCLEAFELGDVAENANLQAWARGMQSFCEYYAGRYDQALSLATDGLIYAGDGPQSVRLTINGVARASGKLGDVEGVRRAVDQSYNLMTLNDVPGGVPSSISLDCYSAAQTASNAATAYVSLGMPKEVQRYVDSALPDISKYGSAWSRSLVMIDLGLSLIRAREAELDQATVLLSDALSISAGRPVISVQKRASEFVREATGRWGANKQINVVRDAMATQNHIDESS